MPHLAGYRVALHHCIPSEDVICLLPPFPPPSPAPVPGANDPSPRPEGRPALGPRWPHLSGKSYQHPDLISTLAPWQPPRSLSSYWRSRPYERSYSYLSKGSWVSFSCRVPVTQSIGSSSCDCLGLLRVVGLLHSINSIVHSGCMLHAPLSLFPTQPLL